MRVADVVTLALTCAAAVRPPLLPTVLIGVGAAGVVRYLLSWTEVRSLRPRHSRGDAAHRSIRLRDSAGQARARRTRRWVIRLSRVRFSRVQLFDEGAEERRAPRSEARTG